MNDRLPHVSVVIPTYNAPALLLETLDTVFAQTFSDYEVVVVNDGSTDDTAERLKQLADAGKIRLVNQSNGGIGNARNRGIDEARGKYVALLDHDDLWMPAKLQAQVEFMETHPESAGCGVPWALSPHPEKPMCNFREIVDERGNVVRPLHQLATGQVFLISSNILFDRAKAKGLRYMPNRKCIEDTPFQVKLLARGRFGIAGEGILMLYRVHSSNYSSQADFFYNGIKMLRAMDAAGEFSELRDQDRDDLLCFFAHLGRSATASQLTTGRRLKALNVYGSELVYQVRDHAWKYLVGTPALACSPRSLSRRIFARVSGRDGG
jgi:glycosyltransferase involved in cell wall biosynthesis